MAEYLEDEVKFRILDFEADLLEDKICQMRPHIKLSTVFERNILFDGADGRLQASGWRLRLRETYKYGGQTALFLTKRDLTLKSIVPAAERAAPNLVRKEINVALDDKMLPFFEIMRAIGGMKQLFLYEKIKQEWLVRISESDAQEQWWGAICSSRSALVTLSQLPKIGYMLEIEGPGNLDIAQELGLNSKDAFKSDTYELYYALAGRPLSGIVPDAVFNPPIVLHKTNK